MAKSKLFGEPATTIKIYLETRKLLKLLAAKKQMTMAEYLHHLLSVEYKKVFAEMSPPVEYKKENS